MGAGPAAVALIKGTLVPVIRAGSTGCHMHWQTCSAAADVGICAVCVGLVAAGGSVSLVGMSAHTGTTDVVGAFKPVTGAWIPICFVIGIAHPGPAGIRSRTICSRWVAAGCAVRYIGLNTCSGIVADMFGTFVFVVTAYGAVRFKGMLAGACAATVRSTGIIVVTIAVLRAVCNGQAALKALVASGRIVVQRPDLNKIFIPVRHVKFNF